jgi:branched-chain amino acid transport system ATP-binding protein
MSPVPPAAPAAGGDEAVALRIEGLERRFGGITAVDGVSFTLGSSERLAIIGPNGAGKTTLFRLVAGEIRPTRGRVHLFGRDVTRMPVHGRARMGLARTFQVSNLFGTLSVADNARLAAQARHRDRWRFWSPTRRDDGIAGAVDAILRQVGLERRRSARVAELSHGEQRQLEIGMALATEPRILLLDEPAAGLAAGERARLRQMLDDLPRSLPLVLIEHDMSLAMGVADRVLCLHNGQPIALGSVAEVRDDRRVQAIYLGRSALDA